MNKDVFTYSYSASANKEVQEIRKKYLPKAESKLEELKRLDRDVQLAGMAEGLTAGIFGCLLFGAGLCLAKCVIVGGLALGVLAGAAGAAVMLAAFPIYRYFSDKTKTRLVPRILALASELTNEKEL